MASASRDSTEVSREILEEMKESRDQEFSPYLVAYFDAPDWKPLIYLVIRNVGKSTARDVSLEFDPPLVNSRGSRIDEMPFVVNGIPAMPPEYEIRHFIDLVHSFFGSSLPLTYKVKIAYSGGLKSETRTTEQIIDLASWKHLQNVREKGVNELVNEVEKLVRKSNGIEQNLGNLAENVRSGIWIRTPELLTADMPMEPESWSPIVMAKLTEFKMLWAAVYGAERKENVRSFQTELQNRVAMISSQVLIISSKAPPNTPQPLVDSVLPV
jgi:hypothetical protein